MTNEEAIEILTAAGKRRAKPELFDALDMGIAVLKSQERMQRELKSLDGIAETCDKLEWALEMAVHDSDKSGTDIWCHDCPYGDDERLDHCCDCGVEYYKREAGINEC